MTAASVIALATAGTPGQTTATALFTTDLGNHGEDPDVVRHTMTGFERCLFDRINRRMRAGAAFGGGKTDDK